MPFFEWLGLNLFLRPLRPELDARPGHQVFWLMTPQQQEQQQHV
jgi:hypothetical protein